MRRLGRRSERGRTVGYGRNGIIEELYVFILEGGTVRALGARTKKIKVCFVVNDTSRDH